MQTKRLQVLLQTLVVSNLCWDRNGHGVAAGAASKFNRLAARMTEEVKGLDTEEGAVRSVFDGFTNQRTNSCAIKSK